jgi:hypothetical protein
MATELLVYLPSFTSAEMEFWPASSYEAKRLQILLCIQPHSTALLVNRPVLIGCTGDLELDSSSTQSCVSEVAIAIEQDLVAAKELSIVVSCIARKCLEFIDRTAIWWICNYSSRLCSLSSLSTEAHIARHSQPPSTSLAYFFSVRLGSFSRFYRGLAYLQPEMPWCIVRKPSN